MAALEAAPAVAALPSSDATNLHQFHGLASEALLLSSGTYTKVRTLAQCQFGKVHALSWHREGHPDTLVAGKSMLSVRVHENVGKEANESKGHFNPQGPPPASGYEDALNEIGIMFYLKKQSDAPAYLLKMYETFVQADNTVLTTEHIPGGELFTVVANDSGIPFGQLAGYLRQMLIAVRYLHRHHIAHRDISLENTLVDGAGDIRIMDFGQACATHSPSGSHALRYFRAVGKDYYRAPECYVPCKSREARVVVPGGKAPGETIFASTLEPSCYLCDVTLPADAVPGQACQASLAGYLPVHSDMFALGVCFFVLVWKFPPWTLAVLGDKSFRFIINKGIPALMRAWNKPLLPDIWQDLLDRLIRLDPAQRSSAGSCLEAFPPLPED